MLLFLHDGCGVQLHCCVHSCAVLTRMRRKVAGPLDALLGAPPVLLDVREEAVFARNRPERASNVPLYKQLVRL